MCGDLRFIKTMMQSRATHQRNKQRNYPERHFNCLMEGKYKNSYIGMDNQLEFKNNKLTNDEM